jgi:hypothetical protein
MISERMAIFRRHSPNHSIVVFAVQLLLGRGHLHLIARLVEIGLRNKDERLDGHQDLRSAENGHVNKSCMRTSWRLQAAIGKGAEKALKVIDEAGEHTGSIATAPVE